MSHFKLIINKDTRYNTEPLSSIQFWIDPGTRKSYVVRVKKGAFNNIVCDLPSSVNNYHDVMDITRRDDWITQPIVCITNKINFKLYSI